MAERKKTGGRATAKRPKATEEPVEKKPAPEKRPRQATQAGGFGWVLGGLMLAGLVLLVAGALRTLGVEVRNGEVLHTGMWSALVGVYAGCAVAAWGVLRVSGWRGDEGFAGGMFVLCAMGMLVQGRLGVYAEDGVWRTMTGLGVPLGMAGFLGAVLLLKAGRLKDWGWLGYVCYALAVAALLAMLVFGRKYRGGIYLPGRINPTEVVKPLLVIFSAMFLQRRGKAFAQTQMGVPMPPGRDLLLLGALWLAPAGMVFMLHDLGLLMLLNVVLVVMLYVASGRFRYIPLGLAAGAMVCVVLGWVSKHVGERMAVWRDPFSDSMNKGWQALQGLTAMFAGGTFGAGLGEGMPEAVSIVRSDFVYAAIAEELGLLGCALLIGLYLFWFVRGWRIAGAAGNGFAVLLGAGLTASLATQTLFNLAGVTKALPMTGITLPFISQGSSSLVVVMVMGGMLAALSDTKR